MSLRRAGAYADYEAGLRAALDEIRREKMSETAQQQKILQGTKST
jgi:hypothetical protein